MYLTEYNMIKIPLLFIRFGIFEAELDFRYNIKSFVTASITNGMASNTNGMVDKTNALAERINGPTDNINGLKRNTDGFKINTYFMSCIFNVMKFGSNGAILMTKGVDFVV